MNPFLLLEQVPVLAPVIGVLAGIALAASPLAWPMAVATLATLALLLLARLTHAATDGGRHVHFAQRVAGGVLVVVGLFFAWQASGMGLAVAPTLP